jgi:hypothetical protein
MGPTANQVQQNMVHARNSSQVRLALAQPVEVQRDGSTVSVNGLLGRKSGAAPLPTRPTSSNRLTDRFLLMGPSAPGCQPHLRDCYDGNQHAYC